MGLRLSQAKTYLLWKIYNRENYSDNLKQLKSFAYEVAQLFKNPPKGVKAIIFNFETGQISLLRAGTEITVKVVSGRGTKNEQIKGKIEKDFKEEVDITIPRDICYAM